MKSRKANRENINASALSDFSNAGVERLLASDYVEGVGAAYAKRLVEKFGKDTIEILLNDPEKACEIKGFGASRAETAHDSLEKIREMIPLLLFLYSCGVSDMFVERILGKYRKRALEIVLEDPYSMVEDVWQLGFFTADKIGKYEGISTDDPRRLIAAIVSAVKHYAEAGHLYATKEEAADYAAHISGVDRGTVEREIPAAIESGRIIESRGVLYLPVFYRAEKEGATRLNEIAGISLPEISDDVIPLKSESGHTYSPAQKEAIRLALRSPVTVITGGPGSGKTTVVKGIIDVLEKEGKKVILAAPTGRAAKRLSVLTGAKASTIHSLLGYRAGEGYHNKRIEADMLIIDEGSMMEQVLFNHLLESVGPETRILLIGDVDQLPAIGAGDVMRDMIKSGEIAVARLNENFRQSEGSLIASGAKSINSGEMPESDPEGDFVIIPESSPKRIHSKILDLVSIELPESRGIPSTDILVVTPQQIGLLGARQLNMDIQNRVNPVGPALRRGAVIMRFGDPVMQTANSRERGVFNGEVGRITSLSEEEQTLTVTFSDGRESVYKRSELTELVLAYATTVHKLQGSEAKNIIIPVTMSHRPMLYRNLIYTAVSRATDLCILVGEEEALRYAVENTPASTRNSNFASRLRFR